MELDELDLSGVMFPDYIKSEKLGWLDPNGDFHKCDYYEHSEVAYKLYGTYDTESLARRGIVHVFWNNFTNKTDYYVSKALTDAQVKWLTDNDIKIYKGDLGKI